MNKKYTKELLEPVVKNSISYAECLKKLNLIVAGGNYSNLQRNIKKFNIDTSHMLHNAHNLNKEIKPFEDLIKPASIKRRLVSKNGHICESCGLSKWLDEPIPLELHHIDGDNRNNSKENLQVLCPNCHAQTDTWRRKNRRV